MAAFRNSNYKATSGWNAILPPRRCNPPLTDNIKVKYAIVGAGYGGMAVARRLAEIDPDATITLLDANEVGEGASGRNSGFISLARVENNEKGRQVAKFTESALDEVKRLISELNIECEFRKLGSYRCSTTDRGAQELEGNRRFLVGQGMPHKLMSKAELKEHLGTDYYSHGLHIDDTYLLQPAAFIRGLAQNLPEQVKLYENSPVTKISRSGDWHLNSPQGTVMAKTLVLTTHSFMRQLGYLSDKIVAVFTYAGLTPVLVPAVQATLGADVQWGISPTFKYGTTMRKQPDGRMFFRSLYSYEKEINLDEVRSGVTKAMRAHFPQLEGIELENVWGGVLAMTRHRAPVFGQIGEGIFATAGCNGSGIAKFSMLGKLLGDEIMGTPRKAEVEQVFGKAGWIPPEPFRSIGYNFVSVIGKQFAGKDA